MLAIKEMQRIADSYKEPRVCVLGSHSALDVCEGAKREGLTNLVLCKKGREKTYSDYYKTRKEGKKEVGCVDEIILYSDFKEMAGEKQVKELVKHQCIFVPNRSFSVYVGYENIENNFAVPIFGNRALLRAEERGEKKNQGWLLEKAGIAVPKKFSSAKKIDRLVIVKAPQAKRSYERAFFFADSNNNFEGQANDLIKRGIATKEGIENALIEEVVLGAHYNFNFFYSPLSGKLELLGTDMRRQTNLDGILRLPAWEQMKLVGPESRIGREHIGLSNTVQASNVEVGHIACTIRESLLEKVFEAGEKFVHACREHYAPGLIGPFALQGAIVPKENSEEIVIFDVSFRMPGSPGVRFTPYTDYLHGESISCGRRVAIEIKEALKQKRLGEIVT